MLGIKLVHLLWALHFLKVYVTEDVSANFFEVTRTTYRKWVWKVLGCLYQYLNVVSDEFQIII